MPFTISHVAAVIPFARPLARWRLLSAMVIGSMVPDFGLLLPWRPPRIETHSALGLITFCLPVGMATFWIFQYLIKAAIIEILPDGAHRRWLPFGAPADLRSLTQWLLAAAGIEVGALSHLVWDAFTHEGARGVRMIPILDDPAVDFAGHHLVGTRLLQDVSSLAGLILVLLLLVYGLRPGRGPAIARRLRVGERWGWAAAYTLAAVLISTLFVLRRQAHGLGSSLAVVVANYAVAALRGSAAALVIVSTTLIIRLRTIPDGSAQANERERRRLGA